MCRVPAGVGRSPTPCSPLWSFPARGVASSLGPVGSHLEVQSSMQMFPSLWASSGFPKSHPSQRGPLVRLLLKLASEPEGRSHFLRWSGRDQAAIVPRISCGVSEWTQRPGLRVRGVGSQGLEGWLFAQFPTSWPLWPVTLCGAPGKREDRGPF